jgi:hypothetical protein
MLNDIYIAALDGILQQVSHETTSRLAKLTSSGVILDAFTTSGTA